MAGEIKRPCRDTLGNSVGLNFFRLSLLLFFLASTSVNAETKPPSIVTKTFDVYIHENCSEGELSCNDVTYHSVNRKTGQGISLKGSVINVKPSMDFAGYEFDNGGYQYIVLDKNQLNANGEDEWNISVYHKGKTIFSEDGITPN